MERFISVDKHKKNVMQSGNVSRALGVAKSIAKGKSKTIPLEDKVKENRYQGDRNEK